LDSLGRVSPSFHGGFWRCFGLLFKPTSVRPPFHGILQVLTQRSLSFSRIRMHVPNVESTFPIHCKHSEPPRRRYFVKAIAMLFYLLALPAPIPLHLSTESQMAVLGKGPHCSPRPLRHARLGICHDGRRRCLSTKGKPYWIPASMDVAGCAEQHAWDYYDACREHSRLHSIRPNEARVCVVHISSRHSTDPLQSIRTADHCPHRLHPRGIYWHCMHLRWLHTLRAVLLVRLSSHLESETVNSLSALLQGSSRVDRPLGQSTSSLLRFSSSCASHDMHQYISQLFLGRK